MKRGHHFIVILCLLAGGCASITAIEPAKPATIGDITVDSQVQWANIKLSSGEGTVWTIDGFGLNELRFFTAIAPGQPLMSVAGVLKKDLPAYDGSMLPNDVMDFVAATLGKARYQQVRTATLRPSPFGKTNGFRFDLTFTAENGLQMKGTALAAQRNGKLDVILFFAPVEHYYDHYAPMVEKVFASIRTA